MSLGELSRFAREELERSGSREEAAARIGPLNHASRLLAFLRRALAEHEEACAAFLDNVAAHERAEAAAQQSLAEAGARMAEVIPFESRRSLPSHGSWSTRSAKRSRATWAPQSKRDLFVRKPCS